MLRRRTKLLALATPILAIGLAIWFANRARLSWQPQLILSAPNPCTIAVSHDGHWLATGEQTPNQLLDLWSGASRPLPVAYNWQFSADDQWLIGWVPNQPATNSRPDQILLLRTDDLQTVLRVPGSFGRSFSLSTNPNPGTAVMLKDGSLRLLNNDKIQDWKPGAAKPFRQVVLPKRPTSIREEACAFSPDGSKLLRGLYDENAEGPEEFALDLVDCASGKITRHLPSATDLILDVRWSPDQNLIAVTEDEGVGTSIRDAASGRQLWTFETRNFAFSHDGKFIGGFFDFEEDDYGLKFRDSRTGHILNQRPAPALDTSGRFVLTADDSYFLIWVRSKGIYRIRMR